MMGDRERFNMKKNEGRRKKIYSILRLAASIIFFLALAFMVGYLSGSVFSGFFAKNINSDKLYIELFKLYIAFMVVLVGYFIHTIIHEAGHLVFGLMSGYKFVSFRVGSFTIIGEDGRFKLKRFNIPGTGGQCLMMPPEKVHGTYPFILYNLGGVIMNTLVAIITIMIALTIKDLSLLKVSLVLISVGGIIAAVTNGIPLKIGGISNDAHNIMSMVKSKDARDSFYLQLKVNGLQSQGIRIKDLPYKDFELHEDLDYTQPLNFSRIFLNHNYHLDNMDFEKAREALEFGNKYVDDTILIYKLEMAGESLFLELIGDCNANKIEALYNKNLKKYIKASKYMIGKKRIMMAYQGIYRKDKEKALEYFEELKELSLKYPVKGETEMEIMLAGFLKDKIV